MLTYFQLLTKLTKIIYATVPWVVVGGGSPAKWLSQVADIVYNVLGQSHLSITGIEEGMDSTAMQLMKMQHRYDNLVFINNFYSRIRHQPTHFPLQVYPHL